MPPDQRIQIKQNTILIFSVSTFLALAGAIFWLGQEFNATKTRLENTVTIYEMDRWERQTQRLNAGWIGAGALDLRQSYERKHGNQ
jgi:hypothetical protein